MFHIILLPAAVKNFLYSIRHCCVDVHVKIAVNITIVSRRLNDTCCNVTL